MKTLITYLGCINNGISTLSAPALVYSILFNFANYSLLNYCKDVVRNWRNFSVATYKSLTSLKISSNKSTLLSLTLFEKQTKFLGHLLFSRPSVHNCVITKKRRKRKLLFNFKARNSPFSCKTTVFNRYLQL